MKSLVDVGYALGLLALAEVALGNVHDNIGATIVGTHEDELKKSLASARTFVSVATSWTQRIGKERT